MSVTLDDVSKHLGLSISTVSKALNGYSDISPATKERIEEAAVELGYHPNMAARNLRRQQTEKIGVVVNYPINLVDDFLSELIPGAALAAEQADYNLILYTSVARHPEQISKICRAHEVDGLLLLWPPELDSTLELMAQESMPYIVLPRRVTNEQVPYIGADHEASGRQLTQHLLDLGHTRIGFVTYPDLYETNADRLKGYQDALHSAEIPFDIALVVETGGNKPGGEKPDRGEAILQAFFDLTEPPTAIMGFNDPIAMQLMAAADQRGIQIPDDLSITGHDGILISGMTVPALTTARQPIPEMGRLAVESLLACIQNPELPPAQHLLPIEIVARKSTCAVKLVAEHC